MEPEIQQLLKIFDDLIVMLESYDEHHWANWMGNDARRLRNGDLAAITHFFGA